MGVAFASKSTCPSCLSTSGWPSPRTPSAPISLAVINPFRMFDDAVTEANLRAEFLGTQAPVKKDS
jgi:hypothetical protein